MMRRRPIETVMAIVVVLGTVAFFFFALSVGKPRISDAIEILAKPRQADGLLPDAPVRVAGVEIGRVVGIGLDPKGFEVTVRMRVSRAVPIFDDSSASIRTGGLFGGKFVEIDPGGGSDKRLGNGGVIPTVEPSILIDELIERIVSFAEEARKKPKAAN
ncbi:MAG: MCE family protein [Alphaproteobacteria bacterium]|nr:MCE family protein [Alphaproteobacteria bacterium]